MTWVIVLSCLFIFFFIWFRTQHGRQRHTSVLYTIPASHLVRWSWSWMLEGKESLLLAGPCVGCLLLSVHTKLLTMFYKDCDMFPPTANSYTNFMGQSLETSNTESVLSHILCYSHLELFSFFFFYVHFSSENFMPAFKVITADLILYFYCSDSCCALQNFVLYCWWMKYLHYSLSNQYLVNVVCNVYVQ